ncbi:hypothetical protein AB6E04_16850 [Vibrio amylolyticus]|uniref:hypothetical protein n=1 Tax=Vibrio amylolyticus TaxID=2847292 RepID=UPI00354FED42
MMSERKKNLNTIIRNEYSNLSGLTVLIKGQLEHEYYSDGYDENSTVHVASVTKSILSILWVLP